MAFGAKNVRNSTAVKAPAIKAEEKREPKVLPATNPLPTPEDNNPALQPAGTNDTIDGDALAAIARGFGARGDEFMATTITTVAKAREDWQGGPIMALYSLHQAFTPEEIASWPHPDVETGNNPFKFTVSVYNGDTKTTKKSNFAREFVEGSKPGQDMNERIDWLKRAGDKGAIKDGIPEEIMAMTPEQRSGEIGFCETRKRTMEQSYIKALRLHFKVVEVQEYDPSVAVSPVWAAGHTPEDAEKAEDPTLVRLDKTNEPMAVCWTMPEGQPDKWEYFTIGAFLKLNPLKAEEKGGGWRALLESGATKKAPRVPGKADKPEDLKIKTPDTAIGVAVVMHDYLLNIQGERDGADWGKLVQMLTQKGNDEYVVTFVELKNMFSDLCRDNKLDLKYANLKKAGSDLIADAA